MADLNLRHGDAVTLVTPENMRLNGAAATVAALADWGAHVETPAAATGRFRAAWDEMRPADRPDPRAAGYTGDVCGKCQGSRMVMAGKCPVCTDCGEQGGCS